MVRVVEEQIAGRQDIKDQLNPRPAALTYALANLYSTGISVTTRSS